VALPVGVLLGGPLDGHQLGRASRPMFVWVAGGEDHLGRTVKVRCYVVPSPKRHLYRSLVMENDREIFLYAGHTHRLCECGGYNVIASTTSCQLCGEPLTPGRVGPS
jgi:hypothetical protein